MTLQFFEIDLATGAETRLDVVPTMGFFRAKLEAEFGEKLVANSEPSPFAIISPLQFQPSDTPQTTGSRRPSRTRPDPIEIKPSYVLSNPGIEASDETKKQFEERANYAFDCIYAEYFDPLTNESVILQPLLMTDFRLINEPKRNSHHYLLANGIHFDFFTYPNPDKTSGDRQASNRYAAAVFLDDNAPILWVDEDQYDHPAPDSTAPNAPNAGEVVQIDGKLKPGWTRVHYVDAGTNTLRWFYVLYDLHPRSGGGSAAMRVDPLAEVEWAWSGSEYGRGIALGLNLTRQVIVAPVGFHTTNTPRSQLFAPDDVHSGNPSTPNANDVGGIQYYKQFKTDLPAKRNKPQNPTAPRLPSTKKKAQLKPNRLFRKKRKEQSLTHGQGAGREDAGGVVNRALFDFVHESLRRGSKLSATKYVEAMHTGNGEFKSTDMEFTNAWNAHTNGRQPQGTSQEWCHLHGHGDGGQEEYPNFVAGSKHCNTEQLAIELGLRTGKYPGLTGRVTAYLFPSQGHGPANITREQIEAKLSSTPQFRSDSNSNRKRERDDPAEAIAAALNQIFPEKRTAIPASRSGAERKKSTPDGKTFEQIYFALEDEPEPNLRERIQSAVQSIKKSAGVTMPLPIAQWMRYKIYYENPKDVHNKIFDHIFDAQSESFDANEFAILRNAVERAVAYAVGDDAIQAYNDRMTARLDKIRREAAESAPMDIEPPPQ